MIPQKQLNRGATSASGDCHRTCVAMILNMHRDDVPHFMRNCAPDMPDDHPYMQAAKQEELWWLEDRGLSTVDVPFPGETSLSELLTVLERLAHGPVVLGCTSSNGFNHSVVIHEGKVHNPNDGSIVGPMRDGLWWITVYSVGANWRSFRLRDRLRRLKRLAMELLPS